MCFCSLIYQLKSTAIIFDFIILIKLYANVESSRTSETGLFSHFHQGKTWIILRNVCSWSNKCSKEAGLSAKL